MTIILEYHGPMRTAAGCAEETIGCGEGTTVGEMLDRLATERGGQMADWLRRSSVLVAVNDRQASRATVLFEGARVALIPPVAGGQP